MPTASTIWKSLLEISRSRCMNTGSTVSGSARLPIRRAQIAHLEVRMRMRIGEQLAQQEWAGRDDDSRRRHCTMAAQE
jgi:hypothetical protein